MIQSEERKKAVTKTLLVKHIKNAFAVNCEKGLENKTPCFEDTAASTGKQCKKTNELSFAAMYTQVAHGKENTKETTIKPYFHFHIFQHFNPDEHDLKQKHHEESIQYVHNNTYCI